MSFYQSQDRFNTRTKSVHYRHRILLMLIVSELIALGVFFYWPSSDLEEFALNESSQDLVTIEEVLVTVQSPAAPAPPKPRVPVLAPEYEIVEEDIEIEEIQLPELPNFSESEISGAGKADGEEAGGPVTNPSRPPNVLKIVEPTLPKTGRKVKAEITVRFLVTAQGNVEEVSISDITLFDDKMNATKAQEIGKGVEEAVLEAAYQWKFRPAKNLGKNVSAYTRHIFSIGF